MVVYALNASPYKIWPFLEAGKESLPNVKMEILITTEKHDSWCPELYCSYLIVAWTLAPSSHGDSVVSDSMSRASICGWGTYAQQ